MHQFWQDLLFAHWPLPTEALRNLIPPQLALDTFQNQGWVGVVPFRMSGIRARSVPPLPGFSSFPELNVRTYVIYGGKPGVYFFSLDAANRPAVWAVRRFYHLPYFYAEMTTREHEGVIHYSSRRRSGSAEFQASYSPISPVRARQNGSLEHWLTERYCLYTVHEKAVYRCDIHHQPWPLQDAQVQIERNTVAQASGIDLPKSEPVLHFARRLEVLIWPLRRADNPVSRV